MRFRSLASGSGGNCLAVRSGGGTLVLVDCGLSCRRLAARAKACGFSLGDAAAVLFTHDHADHTDALATFHKKYPGVPLLANGDTADAIAAKTGVEDGWVPFETGTEFDVGDFRVTAFSTSHDAADPVGFLLADAASTLFVGTDTGVVTAPLRDAFARATCAVLESNHDPMLLEASDRPWPLKRRISGRSGHLSNEQAVALVHETHPAALRILLLAHLSRQCNAPDIALERMRDELAALRRTDVTLAALAQDEPSALYTF